MQLGRVMGAGRGHRFKVLHDIGRKGQNFLSEDVLIFCLAGFSLSKGHLNVGYVHIRDLSTLSGLDPHTR